MPNAADPMSGGSSYRAGVGVWCAGTWKVSQSSDGSTTKPKWRIIRTVSSTYGRSLSVPPVTWIVVSCSANGATSRRPDSHCDSVPAMCVSPPRGRRGWTVIGGRSASDSSSTPSSRSASSRALMGRRRKYFMPVSVTGRSASAARPVMK